MTLDLLSTMYGHVRVLTKHGVVGPWTITMHPSVMPSLWEAICSADCEDDFMAKTVSKGPFVIANKELGEIVVSSDKDHPPDTMTIKGSE